jgi:hypothetical protein
MYTFPSPRSCFYLSQLFCVWHKTSLNYNVKWQYLQNARDDAAKAITITIQTSIKVAPYNQAALMGGCEF